MSAAGGRPDDAAARPCPSVAAFEDGTLDVEAFDQQAHVYVAWCLIRDCGVIDALQRYASALRRLLRALRQDGKYHETLTGCLMLIIAERIARAPQDDWPAFVRANRDLLQDSRALLMRYYSPARLDSSAARRQFLLPDRLSDHASEGIADRDRSSATNCYHGAAD